MPQTWKRLPDGCRQAGRCLLLALAVMLLTVVFFSPRFVCWRTDIPEIWRQPERCRAMSTMMQIADPWRPITNDSNRVISWRLALPLLWHYLELPFGLFLTLPFAGCVAALWLAAWLSRQHLPDERLTAMTVLLFAALPWFFVSTGWLTYFDSWLVLGIMVVAFVRGRVSLAAACLLLPWVDERFLFAVPVNALLRAAMAADLGPAGRRRLLGDWGVMALAVLPYVAARGLTLVWGGDRGSLTSLELIDRALLTVPWTDYAAGWWSGFRVAWLLVLAAPVLWWRRGARLPAAVLGMLTVLLSAGGLLIAGDMSRTMMIFAPLLLAAIWWWQEQHPRSLRVVLPAVLAANLLLPARHVVWGLTIPVSGLLTELRDYRDPPPRYFADAWCTQGIAHARRGDRAAAIAALSTAIELNPQLTPARLWRAIVQQQAGDTAAAAADLEAVLRQSPALPDALLLRAEMRAAQGRADEALADARRALAVARADWPQRAQALALQQRLAGRR